jgi:hypothetical protein
MPKQEQHDMREYHIMSEILDIGGGAATWYFGVPQAGSLVRALYTSTTAQASADALLTFAVNTVDLGQTLTVPSSAGAVGRNHVVDFSVVPGSFCYEPEHLDLIAVGGTIAVDTDGGGTGTGRITLVIRP